MKRQSICERCGESFTYNDKTSIGKYCSCRCNGAALSLSHTIKIEEGTVRQPETLKRYLRRTNGNVCSICGIQAMWQGKSLSLQLDHIDGNSDNNLPTNIRLVCPNCHSQTPTFSTRQKKDTVRNRYLRKLKGYAP